jgi:hypothetical protein
LGDICRAVVPADERQPGDPFAKCDH